MTWDTLIWVAVMVLAYLMGSVPSAYIAGRLVGGMDIREMGDRNPGAANAYRIIGPRAGLTVGFVDILKGLLAVLLARVLLGGTIAPMAAGVMAVIGHNWSLFLNFQGGRGAATAIGVFIGLIPIPALSLSLFAFAILPVVKSTTKAIALIMIPMPLLAWVSDASYALVVYAVCLPIGVGVKHYFSSRKLDRQQQDRAEGQALRQG